VELRYFIPIFSYLDKVNLIITLLSYLDKATYMRGEGQMLS